VSLAKAWERYRGIGGEHDRIRLKRAFYAGAAALYSAIADPDDPPLDGEAGEPPAAVSDEQFEAVLRGLVDELNAFAAEVKAGRA
jgi:hypothetical protein